MLVLGDSFASGWGVSFEQTFTARLSLEHPEWNIRNAAVAGYGADQNLLVLSRLVPQFRPEVVVCVFCDNDLWESSSDEAYGRGKPQFEIDGDSLRLRVAHVEQSWMQEHRALFAAARKKLWAAVDEPARSAVDGHWNERGHSAVAGLRGPVITSELARLPAASGRCGIVPDKSSNSAENGR